MQNLVYIGTDTPVIIDFEFDGEFEDDGLLNFTDIVVEVGDEQYSTSINPTKVVVGSSTELRILIGDSTALAPGNYVVTLTGYNAYYNDGIVLAGSGKPLGKIRVVNLP